MGSAFYLGEQKITNIGVKVESQGVDTSKGNATTTDIAQNMIAYVKGKEVVGSVPVIGTNIVKSFTGGNIINNNDGTIGIYKQTDSHMLLREGSVIHMYTNASNFGTATVNDVVNTKTFTSANGVAISGNVTEKKEGELFSASGDIVTFSEPDDATNPNFIANWNTSGNNLLREGVNIQTPIYKDNFGNATADQVLAGCSFTSQFAGIKKYGNIITKNDSDIIVTNSNITIPKGYYNSDIIKQISSDEKSNDYNFGWHIEDVDAAQYNFILQDDGYYKSQNVNINGSAALCKISFKAPDNYNLYLDCICSGEGKWDYALFSLINTDLSTSNSADSASLLKDTIQGTNATEYNITKTITYESVTEGYVIIKFIKDNTTHKGADCLRFKVRLEPKSSVSLPTLSSPADVSHVLSGRQFIDGSGVAKEGTMATITQNAPTIQVDDSTGKITASCSQSTSGYMSAGTKSTSQQITSNNLIASNIKSGVKIFGVTGTYSGTSTGVNPTYTQTAKTWTPTTTNQTIAAGTYCSGAQTILGDSNLIAANIKSGVSIFGVTGTYSGEGGGATSGSWAKTKATSVSLGSLSSYGSTSISIPYGSKISVSNGALALSGSHGAFTIDKTNTEDDCNNLLGYFISISSGYGTSSTTKFYYIPPTATFTVGGTYSTSITCNEANEIVILA